MNEQSYEEAAEALAAGVTSVTVGKRVEELRAQGVSEAGEELVRVCIVLSEGGAVELKNRLGKPMEIDAHERIGAVVRKVSWNHEHEALHFDGDEGFLFSVPVALRYAFPATGT